MSVTAMFTKGGSAFMFSFLAGNNGYEMQDHRMIIQINIDSEVSSIRVFLQNLKI
ncbi:hypothetical protein PVAP13_8KG229612 [Panicum virgatum]|uniref:Uncharacterized protein n=1 Tax=Panicum virgatum TaxID=38727 RepID=A0A8T0PMJ7_PANVG|nr:hypothetical protein PVAP13_8KG229612 [Panicum virgatum]